MFKLKKEIYILCFGIFITSFSDTVSPMLTLILRQHLNMNASKISIVLAINLIALSVATIIGGKLSDSFNRKYLIIFFDTISMVMYLLGALLPFSLWTIFFAIAGGMFQQIETVAYNTLIAEFSDEEDRDKAYSLDYLFFNLGLLLSTAVAGFWVENHIKVLFFVNAAGLFASILMLSTFFKYKTSVQKKKNDEKTEPVQNRKGVLALFLTMPHLIVYLIFVCIWDAIHGQYAYWLPMEVDRIVEENPSKVYGLLVSFSCLIILLFTTFETWLVHKKTYYFKMHLSNVLHILGFALFFIGLYQCRIWILYVGFALFIFGEIANVLYFSPYIADHSPPDYHGRVYSVFSMSVKIIPMFYNLLIGFLYDIHYLYSWYTISISLLVSVGLVFVMSYVEKKSMKKAGGVENG